MNILDTIIAQKKLEVDKRKRETSVGELKKGPFFKNETLSFKKFYPQAEFHYLSGL